MTTIHLPPPNLVPTISSGALPTPAIEWAEDMNDILGAHITRTPVGTPGPSVPGGFSALSEPDGAQDASLLETAKAYLPAQDVMQRALGNAKAYLSEEVGAYFPDITNRSSTSLPRQDTSESTAVDIGHGASVPYTHSGPEPYLQAQAQFQPSPSDLPRTPSAFDFPAPPTRDLTNDSTTVHTGHSMSSAISPSEPRCSSAPSVESNSSLPPSTLESTSSTSTFESGSASSTLESASSVHLVSTPVSQSSFDSAPTAYFDSRNPIPTVHSIPTARLADSVHPTPHAIPGPASHLISRSPVSHLDGTSSHFESLASTPSLVASVDSGYAASEESGLATPVDAPPHPFTAHLDPASFRPLNAAPPAGPFTPLTATTTGLNVYRGADSTHQLDPAMGAGAGMAGVGAGGTGQEERETLQQEERNSGSSGELNTSEEIDTGNEKKSAKKPKLMQRLKEKIQVGAGGGEK
ncbi:hypothetical protein C8R43DRAFT_1044451 [Mycena crocata]|nr:hypothetical protein C8R43DRAFT_1044451 [Mycena crocata]